MEAKEFLDKILEKILEGAPKNNKHHFNIEVVADGLFAFTEWASIICSLRRI